LSRLFISKTCPINTYLVQKTIIWTKKNPNLPKKKRFGPI